MLLADFLARTATPCLAAPTTMATERRWQRSSQKTPLSTSRSVQYLEYHLLPKKVNWKGIFLSHILSSRYFRFSSCFICDLLLWCCCAVSSYHITPVLTQEPRHYSRITDRKRGGTYEAVIEQVMYVLLHCTTTTVPILPKIDLTPDILRVFQMITL